MPFGRKLAAEQFWPCFRRPKLVGGRHWRVPDPTNFFSPTWTLPNRNYFFKILEFSVFSQQAVSQQAAPNLWTIILKFCCFLVVLTWNPLIVKIQEMDPGRKKEVAAVHHQGPPPSQDLTWPSWGWPHYRRRKRPAQITMKQLALGRPPWRSWQEGGTEIRDASTIPAHRGPEDMSNRK